MNQTPGDASGVLNVADAELPELIAGRSGSPYPQSNVTGSRRLSDRGDLVGLGGHQEHGGAVPPGSGNVRPVAWVIDSSENVARFVDLGSRK